LGGDFPYPFTPALGPTQLPTQWGRKAAGRGVEHPPHLLPKLKKEQSYISSPPLGLRNLF